MDTFDVSGSLKLQSYINNQNVDLDTMNFLNNTKFSDLLSEEEKIDIERKVNRYKSLEQAQLENVTAENSVEMQELAEDILYATGQQITSLNVNNLKTENDIAQALYQSEAKSKNDLFVDIDYDDYRSSSDYVKCNLVSHNTPYAYGIHSDAKIIVTKSGKIITSKSSLYTK